jgi:hypothetical protein
VLERSSPEGLSEVSHAHEPAFDLLRVGGISGADPLFELVEALFFAVDELLPIAPVVRSDGSEEAAVGVDCPVELQPASDGGERAPILAQGENLCVHFVVRRSLATCRLAPLGGR